jgi:hypothetical protein
MKYFITVIVLFVGLRSGAQSSNIYGTLSTQISEVKFVAAALQYDRYLLRNKKLVIGAGLRATTAFGSSTDFITAPAILTSNQTGPGVLFAPQVNAQIDSYRIDKVGATAFNFMGTIGYRIGTRLLVGFNIDFVGFTLGGKQSASQFDVVSTEPILSAKPTTLNAMLVSDNDWGTLNSELFASYKINPRITAKTGLGFSFVEYTIESIKQNINGQMKDARFRHKSAGLMLGVSYNLKQK